ncbi:SLBB domain-containing protein [Hoylesella nanceiensis]|uniref:SLBB domain-containing protein n=1 Tax=Hoylesella nanceiensis TaxID=425941 RepID=A0ABS6YF54_9BACT|nr:SLBB domain-containing protein [Hoylesella nanceiensis]MBW4769368.1 SLBB domain-containing protein [Hoylesella nanceiensis]
MRKLFFCIFLLISAAQCLYAQSGMTDDQVIRMIQREQKAGSSQAQIVTKLMQSGVDISQIRRLKDKYDRQMNQKGLGNVSDETLQPDDSRMRKNKQDAANSAANKYSNNRIQRNSADRIEINEKDPEFLLMQKELSYLTPKDSIEWLKELLDEKSKMKKKVFGRDIFNNKELSFEPNMNIATPQRYVLGPGDNVIIDVYGASQKTFNVVVSPDGEVTIEDFGPIKVSGLTVEQANAKVRSLLGARYSSSKTKLTVGQTKTMMVNVMGEVKVPGTYTLSAFATVFHALYMAGGINDLGTLRNIKVYRQNRLVTVVDIYDYILNGKLTGNIRLMDNDVIVVGPYDCLVTISGKVKRPMIYEMKKSESVGSIIKYAGGFTGDAYTKAVRLLRKTGREYSVFNIGEFDINSFHLADGDSIGVDSIINRYENMVEIKGAIFRPGMYNIGKDINSVRTLIEHAEGLTEEAFTNRAIIHRMKSDRTLEVIAVDVKGIMDGSVADVPLKKNDVLFIPTKSEMQTKRTITIHGEVNYPGMYVYADHETLEDFILQAGGLKDKASIIKVDVARRILNPKAITNDSVIAKTYTFALKEGFVIDGTPGFELQPFDEVYVRKSPGYSHQQNIQVEGNVMFAGTYTLSSKNERLSDIIKKAGGVTDLAYVPGARLERRITPDERLRMQTVIKMAQMQSGKKDSLDMKKLDLGDTYYVGIELDKALKEPGGDADLVLREFDRIIVPEYNGTVKISGDVMYPNTVAYEKGRNAGWYINQAGGWGNRAKKSHTYIVYMNGTVAKVGHNAKVRPGCEIIVPSKPESSGKSLTQWLSIGTSVASIATMIATMANLLK